MSDEQDFPCEPEYSQDVSASQSNAAQEAGLHVAKVTDHRDFDDWSTDESFCQRFLTNRPREWRIAIHRYWRERCTRRELADELGLDLETVKNMLRRIRKAVCDEQSGKKRKPATEVQWARRCHSEINAADIHAICDGDPEAIAHMEEYGRLNIIERLKMFSPAISGELIKTFEHFEADNQNQAITSGLAKVEKLKAQAVKPDPFIDRPLFSIFPDQRTTMRIPDTDEGVTRWKARTIGRNEAEAIGRGRPRKETKPTEIKPARNSGHFFMSDEMKKQYKLSRNETVRFIKGSELVKQDLAAIAEVPAARLSDYLHEKPVSEEYAARLENAVANIIYVWETFAPIKIALDDPQAFAKAVELANQVHVLAEEQAQELLHDLPVDFDLSSGATAD